MLMQAEERGRGLYDWVRMISLLLDWKEKVGVDKERSQGKQIESRFIDIWNHHHLSLSLSLSLFPSLPLSLSPSLYFDSSWQWSCFAVRQHQSKGTLKNRQTVSEKSGQGLWVFHFSTSFITDLYPKSIRTFLQFVKGQFSLYFFWFRAQSNSNSWFWHFWLSKLTCLLTSKMSHSHCTLFRSSLFNLFF